MHYDRILVALDHGQTTPATLTAATTLAEAWRARLDPVHVPPAPSAPPPETDPAARLLDPGDPAETLLAEAGRDADEALLVLGTRARAAVTQAVLGSVSSTVLRRLYAPMVIVGPAAAPPERPPRRIVVPLDGSTTADTILPVASRWASSLGCSLHLVHVIYPPGDPRQGEVRLPEEVDEVVARLRSHVQTLASEGAESTWQLHEATSSGVGIVDHAERDAADLIAMSTHGRSALARLLAGSTTVEVLRRTRLPVLALRPGGLDSG